MKKYFTLVMLLFVLVLTGCSSYSYEETELKATVIQCEQGTFYPNTEYATMAYVYFSKGEIAEWAKYNSLANSNGSYDYNITINIEGTDYVIVRSKPYKIGQTVIVIQENTYKGSQLLKTEYK